VKNLISRWFKVYEDEIGLFCAMALLLFFINSGSIVLNNFAETAFLKRYGVEYLPVITVINAVVTFILINSLGNVLTMVRGDRMVFRTMIVCGVLVGLLRFVVPLGFDILYPLLYVIKTQFTVLLAFLFWNLASELFSTRQSKRLFPLITSGGIIGGIAGSFATPILARMVSADNLLLLFALLAFAGALSVRSMGDQVSGVVKSEKIEKPQRPTMRGEFGKVVPLIRKSTLAQVLLLLTLLPNIVIPIMNYQFSFVVDQTFSTEAGMLGFYSYFRGAQNLIALVLSLFVGRIYGHFGLPMALMFHPLNYLIAFSAYLAQFNIFSAVYAGVSVGVIRRTINNPATSALYGLLVPKDRTALRAFLRGTVVRIGILTGSGLLWVGIKFMHPRYLSIMAASFVLVWLAGTLLLKKRYSQIVLNLIRGELPDFYNLQEKELHALFKGVDVEPMLLQRFSGSSGEEAVWYADSLRSIKSSELDAAILEKLPRADDATRIALLPYLSAQAGRPAFDVFITFADPEKPELMIALSRTVKRVLTEIPEDVERETFEMAQLPEVKACFLGWMRKGDPERYSAIVAGWLTSDNLPERRAGVLATGEGGRIEDVGTLQSLLENESDPLILELTLLALSRLKVSNLVDQVRPLIDHENELVRLAAVIALLPDSVPSVQVLIKALGDPSGLVRSQAIQQLDGIDYSLQDVLVAALGSQSRRVRDGLFQVIRNLEVKDADVFRFCRNQLKIACEDFIWIELLGKAPKSDARDLLTRHLDEKRERRVENVVRGLAVRDATGQLGVVLRGLHSAGERERADSLEALDSLLDRSISRILVPMIENNSKADLLSAGSRYLGLSLSPSREYSQELDTLLLDADHVTVLLTLELLVSLGRVEAYRNRIETLVDSPQEDVSALARTLLGGTAADVATGQTQFLERILSLRQAELFRDLQVSELTMVALVADKVRFPAGAEIFNKNDAWMGLCLIVKGKVSIERERVDSSGNTVQLAYCGPGDSFGTAMLFGLSPHIVKSHTLQDSIILRIDKEAFYAIAREYPEIAFRAAQFMSESLGSAFEGKQQNRQHEKEGAVFSDDTHSLLPETTEDDADGAMDLGKRALELRKVSLFQHLTTRDVVAVASVSEVLRFMPDTVVLDKDHGRAGLHLVVNGEVSIEQDHSDSSGRGVQLRRFGSGESFAIITLFDVKIPQIRARTVQETTLLRIDRREFRAIILENPEIALRVCEVLAERLGEVIEMSDEAHDTAE
jgi:CRP-like cAMP-binding protein/ATP/ADP translocase